VYNNNMNTNHDRQVVDDLQREILTAISKISAQVEGLDIGFQSISHSINTAPDSPILDNFQKESFALGQRLRVMASAVSAAPRSPEASIEQMDRSWMRSSLR
jgi:hypothetical protein